MTPPHTTRFIWRCAYGRQRLYHIIDRDIGRAICSTRAELNGPQIPIHYPSVVSKGRMDCARCCAGLRRAVAEMEGV